MKNVLHTMHLYSIFYHRTLMNWTFRATSAVKLWQKPGIHAETTNAVYCCEEFNIFVIKRFKKLTYSLDAVPPAGLACDLVTGSSLAPSSSSQLVMILLCEVRKYLTLSQQSLCHIMLQ